MNFEVDGSIEAICGVGGWKSPVILIGTECILKYWQQFVVSVFDSSGVIASFIFIGTDKIQGVVGTMTMICKF